MPVVPVPTPSAPAAAGPYSPAVRAGDWLILAGQVGLDPATGKMAAGGAEAQARQVLANISAIRRPSFPAPITATGRFWMSSNV